MKRLTVMVLALAALAGSGMATSFLGRSSTVNKQYQFFGWTNFGYNQTALSYNWTSGKYATPDGFVATKTTSCDLTLAFGLSSKFDIDVVSPLAMKQKGDAKSAGLGDLMVYARSYSARTSRRQARARARRSVTVPLTSRSDSPSTPGRPASSSATCAPRTGSTARFQTRRTRSATCSSMCCAVTTR